jgi:hypothetical protein
LVSKWSWLDNCDRTAARSVSLIVHILREMVSRYTLRLCMTPRGSLGIPESNSSCSYVTCLTAYVPVVWQRWIIRYMSVTRFPILFVPSDKLIISFLLWTTQVGSLTIIKNIQFRTHQIFHEAFCEIGAYAPP